MSWRKLPVKTNAVRMHACRTRASSDRRSPAPATAGEQRARVWNDRFLGIERALESIAAGLDISSSYAHRTVATCAGGQVRDCAAVLGQLRAQAMAQFERRRQSDRDVLEMRAELVR